MISRAHRFHGYGSLKGVYLRGQTVRGPLVTLKFGQRGPGRPYRVAVVVSRKVHKSAVVRNRIRRRIYELVRQADLTGQADRTDQIDQPDRPGGGGLIAPGSDLVFTVFSDQVAELEAAKLQATVTDLLRKAAARGAPV